MRRALALPVLLSALTMGATATLPATTAVAAPGNAVTLEGTYQHVVADARVGTAHDERDLLVAGDKAYTLRLPKGHSLKPGSKVRVKGKLEPSSDGPQALTADETTVTSTTADAPTAGTNHRVLVILASWTAPDAVTPEQARQQFFVDADAWYREVSYGTLGLTGDVTPWLSIAGPDNGLCYTNHRQTMTQAKAAALAAGFDAATYDRTVLYFPQSENADCAGYAGWAYKPGTEVWLHGAMDRRTTVHELGHNLGLGHAHSFRCSDGGGALVAFASTCTKDEYGDPFDAMGGSGNAAHFAAADKADLGWLAGRVADLSDDGAVLLQPLTSPAGVVGVTITVGTRTFWVEQRTASGMDASLPGGATAGVLVRAADSGLATGQGLLDHTPDASFADSVLAHGASWRLPDGRALTVGLPMPEGTPVAVGPAPTDATPTAPVTSLAFTRARGNASLTWVNPTDVDLADIVALVKTGGHPSSDLADGSVIYTGRSTAAPLSEMSRGTTYTFTVFARDTAGNISPSAWISVLNGKIVASVDAILAPQLTKNSDAKQR